MNSPKTRGVVVFSGGSAANSLVDVFNTLVEHKNCSLSYVIPISDNGGSSSELIRVFGGPGIGDVRSRLVRLIPSDNDEQSEKAAIRTFFNHRLSTDGDKARHEWLDIVEARDPLWNNISSPKKELIRSFLNLLNLEIVKRVRPSSVFNFSNASIGNMFLTGARLFSGSFESGVYLLSSICHVPEHIAVLPAINTNFSHHIAAGLADGTVIVGQNAISHPSAPSALPSSNDTDDFCDEAANPAFEVEAHDKIEDANLPGSLPTLRKPYIAFNKVPDHDDDLPARIERIWYINPYGQEIRPAANPKVIDALGSANAVVYSIGSLYTSLLPSLILRGVGAALAAPNVRYKILILNSSVDRETGPSNQPYSALDFVAAMARGAEESCSRMGAPEPHLFRKYVTHVIYLDGPGAPKLDRDELAALGIETIRLYGRRDGGDFMKYNETALLQALKATIGRRDIGKDRSRRNTVENYSNTTEKPKSLGGVR
ncbi:UPF0052 domain protein [Lineolata rhizophorae]|uniref:UPF0052 domain protein n=1 Tax=Lineolata rhizophorae TaxID=578093 RepID=A0A6A6NPD8_9PEZI|nr:UPF0052 domain protein [Lineolata rhizophorae]